MGDYYEEEEIEIVTDQLDNVKFNQNYPRYPHYQRSGSAADSDDDDEDGGSSLMYSNVSAKAGNSGLFGRKDTLTINDVELYPLPSAHHERKMKSANKNSLNKEPELPEPTIEDENAEWAVLKEKYSSYNRYMLLLPISCVLTAFGGFGIAIFLMTSIPEDESTHRNLIAVSIVLLSGSVCLLFGSINVWRKRGLIKLMYETKLGYLGPAEVGDVFGWTLKGDVIEHYLQIRYGPDNITSLPEKKMRVSEAHFFFCGEGVYLDGQIEPFDGMSRLKDIRVLKIRVGQRQYRTLHLSLQSMYFWKTRIWIIIPDVLDVAVIRKLYTRLLSSCSSAERLPSSGNFGILEEEHESPHKTSMRSSSDSLLGTDSSMSV